MASRAVRVSGWLTAHRLLLWIVVAILLSLLMLAVPSTPDAHYAGSD